MSGLREQRVIVIIPAYNEQDSIVSVVESVVSAGYDYVVVNDGSTDLTLEICRAHNFSVLSLPMNLGIGGAVQAGYKFARQNGYDVAVQFDGDGQHDAAGIPVLLNAIDSGVDLVVGSRFISADNTFYSTALRRLGIKWLQWVIQLSVGKNVTDATSGFRACSRRAINFFCDYYPVDYPEPESIAHAIRGGLVVSEVPAVMHERQGGISSISGLSSLYYMIKVSLAILISRNMTNLRHTDGRSVN